MIRFQIFCALPFSRLPSCANPPAVCIVLDSSPSYPARPRCRPRWGNDTAESQFPLISYLHGLAGGGGLDIEGYAVLFAQMASYGFVVAAPLSCNDGCRDQVNAPYTDCAGLPSVQPANWPSYYGEQLKTMEWAHSAGKEGSDPILSLIDWDAGVGIAGHSMGGQATAITASKNCVVQHFGARIKAAVLHHAANGAVGGGPTPGKTNVGTNVSIPTAAFTSSGDSIWAETRYLRCCASRRRVEAADAVSRRSWLQPP